MPAHEHTMITPARMLTRIVVLIGRSLLSAIGGRRGCARRVAAEPRIASARTRRTQPCQVDELRDVHSGDRGLESTNPSAGCRCLPNARHKFATLGSATPSRSLRASDTVCREHAEHSGLLRARTNRLDRLLGTLLQGGDSLGDERLCVHSLIISTVSTALLVKEF
jgi:hypothetical protein